MTFRERLLATLRAVEPVLEVRGVLVAGSEVPDLLQVDGAATLVVSQAVDLTIPVGVHEEVKAQLDRTPVSSRRLTSHRSGSLVPRHAS